MLAAARNNGQPAAENNLFEQDLLAEMIPALVGGQPYQTKQCLLVHDGHGTLVAQLSKVPRLMQTRMVQAAARAVPDLRNSSEDFWFGAFSQAGDRLFDAVSGGNYIRLATVARRLSDISGLPVVRILHAWQSLASDLRYMQEIMAAQAPGKDSSSYRTGNVMEDWVWVPAGNSAAVRIPSNFPTINITWLQTLAARRPVLLSASPQDPFTPLLLAKLLYEAGVPAGAISLAYGETPAIWKLADQVLWPGDVPDILQTRAGRLKAYHHGRSKSVLTHQNVSSEVWASLANMAVQGCGRLCTNLSTLVVENQAEMAGMSLAQALAVYPILPLEHDRAIIPAFVDRARAYRIVAMISDAVARGATDLSERVTGQPIIVEQNGLLFLRPTVLLLDRNDPLYGYEFPFPFVSVARVVRSKIPEACRGSLIVSLVSEDPELLHDLIDEPSIDKIFHSDFFNRGYQPTDPHEGFLADFLFRKKALLPRLPSNHFQRNAYHD